MEGGQTNEFRPLILVAEDDDSHFKLIKAIIGKKCVYSGPRMAKKSCTVQGIRQRGQSDPDGHQNACDERTGCYEDHPRRKQGNPYYHADRLRFQL